VQPIVRKKKEKEKPEASLEGTEGLLFDEDSLM
jgi:hypothetical protein